MSIYGAKIGVPQWVSGAQCNTGCGSCPEFTIKRHDTRPAFKVAIEDCSGGPADALSHKGKDAEYLIAEVSMWHHSRLRRDLSPDDTYFSLAGNQGFDQILPGDLIIMDQVRQPEQMLVMGFNEAKK